MGLTVSSTVAGCFEGSGARLCWALSLSALGLGSVRSENSALQYSTYAQVPFCDTFLSPSFLLSTTSAFVANCRFRSPSSLSSPLLEKLLRFSGADLFQGPPSLNFERPQTRLPYGAAPWVCPHHPEEFESWNLFPPTFPSNQQWFGTNLRVTAPSTQCSARGCWSHPLSKSSFGSQSWVPRSKSPFAPSLRPTLSRSDSATSAERPVLQKSHSADSVGRGTGPGIGRWFPERSLSQAVFGREAWGCFFRRGSPSRGTTASSLGLTPWLILQRPSFWTERSLIARTHLLTPPPIFGLKFGPRSLGSTLRN